MTVKDFLALPKRLKNPNMRIREEIARLRSQITVIPTDCVREPEKRCCGKQTFATEVEALANITNRGRNSKRPFRAYCCAMGSWHLTALTKKQAQKEITYQNNS